MKIISKEIIPRKQVGKLANSYHQQPKHKGMSKSLSRPIKIYDSNNNMQSKKVTKDKQLQVIKETPKKKKQQKKEKKKKVNYCLNLKQLKPVNLEKQKQIFFQRKGQYNPFFVYPNISDLNDEQYKDMKKFQSLDQSYMGLAIKILQKSMQLGIWKMLTDSQILTKEQTSFYFDSYITDLGFNDLLSYQFVQNTIAPTSVVHNNQDGMSKVLIGIPINYRKKTIEGVLNHQIGTHFIRKYNDKNQKWHKDKKKYNLSPYLKTQQGLAALNQLTSYVMQQSIPPLLYRAALLYFCCCLASKYSFYKIYEIMSKYQPDPQLRWRQCVRVKRGIADTSKPCGMYKDQIYFLGAIQILKNRKKVNLINLHSGKISVDDCLRLTQKNLINVQRIKLPHFMKNMKQYHRYLDIIAEVNMVKFLQ